MPNVFTVNLPVPSLSSTVTSFKLLALPRTTSSLPSPLRSATNGLSAESVMAVVCGPPNPPPACPNRTMIREPPSFGVTMNRSRRPSPLKSPVPCEFVVASSSMNDGSANAAGTGSAARAAGATAASASAPTHAGRQ